MIKLKVKLGRVHLNINHLFVASLGTVTILFFVIPSLFHSYKHNSNVFGYDKKRHTSINVNDFSENRKMKQRKLRGFIERKGLSRMDHQLHEALGDRRTRRDQTVQMLKDTRESRETQRDLSNSGNRSDHRSRFKAPNRLPIYTKPRTLLVNDQTRSTTLTNFLSKPVINPHDFNYMYNPINKCSGRVIDTLFVVPSAISHFSKRRAVRASPLYKYTQNRSNQAAVVFFVGVSQYFSEMQPGHHRKFQTGLDREARLQEDIVQTNFTDTYHNMRLKAVSMLKWASDFCPGAKYVIRTDDDVTVVIDNLMLAIRTVGNTHDNFILGEKANHVGVDRAISSKYYVPKREYAPDHFPPFALGGLLGYPMKTVRLLYQAALRVPAVWLDDVYITALCAKEVNATLVSNQLFVFEHGFVER